MNKSIKKLRKSIDRCAQLFADGFKPECAQNALRFDLYRAEQALASGESAEMNHMIVILDGYGSGKERKK